MRYILVLMLFVTVAFCQVKEQSKENRYVIFLMNTDSEKIPFQHIQIPAIGTPKQVPIKLDTWTGDTWMLDSNLETVNGKNIIRWRWIKIETDLNSLTSK